MTMAMAVGPSPTSTKTDNISHSTTVPVQHQSNQPSPTSEKIIMMIIKYVTLTTDSISILLDTLTTQDGYNTICDTKIQTKLSLQVKKLSKKSQKYIPGTHTNSQVSSSQYH
jgi:hypothetical protein